MAATGVGLALCACGQVDRSPTTKSSGAEGSRGDRADSGVQSANPVRLQPVRQYRNVPTPYRFTVGPLVDYEGNPRGYANLDVYFKLNRQLTNFPSWEVVIDGVGGASSLDLLDSRTSRCYGEGMAPVRGIESRRGFPITVHLARTSDLGRPILTARTSLAGPGAFGFDPSVISVLGDCG